MYPYIHGISTSQQRSGTQICYLAKRCAKVDHSDFGEIGSERAGQKPRLTIIASCRQFDHMDIRFGAELTRHDGVQRCDPVTAAEPGQRCLDGARQLLL